MNQKPLNPKYLDMDEYASLQETLGEDVAYKDFKFLNKSFRSIVYFDEGDDLTHAFMGDLVPWYVKLYWEF